MMKASVISAWARGVSLALMLSTCDMAFGQSIMHVVPQEIVSYGPGEGSRGLDINQDGTTDYILSFSPSGAWLVSQSGNFLITGPGGLVPVTSGSVISSLGSSLDPAFQWGGGAATIGGQAVFDGEYYYAGNFSDTDAFIGLQFQFGGEAHYGWMEIYNYPDVAAGQVLAWAYETSPNTSILAGQVPEPSILTLIVIGGAVLSFQFFRGCSPRTIRLP